MYVWGFKPFVLIISLVFIAFQPIAVEVFSADGRNYLLAFQKGVRNKVYQRCRMQTQTQFLGVGCGCSPIALTHFHKMVNIVFLLKEAHNT